MAKTVIGGVGTGFGIGGGPVTPPSQPTITWTLSGTTVTITVDGDAGVTNLLYQDGTQIDSRSGDGDFVVAGLSPGTKYSFDVVSRDVIDQYSLPAGAVYIDIPQTVGGDFDSYLSGTGSLFMETFKANYEFTIRPAAGGSRSPEGILTLDGPENIDGSPAGSTYEFLLIVANNSTDGYASSEVDLQLDKVDVKNYLGQDVVERTIQCIAWEDVEFVAYEVG